MVIAFCIGTYLCVNGLLEALLYRRPVVLNLIFACCVLGVCALASAHVIPFWIRGLLLPLYPLVFVPLFFAAARVLPHCINRTASGFAAVSYEFYILHFYFIGRGFNELFGDSIRMALEIPISFALVLALATVLYFLNSRLRRPLDAYLLETKRCREGLSAR